MQTRMAKDQRTKNTTRTTYFNDECVLNISISMDGGTVGDGGVSKPNDPLSPYNRNYIKGLSTRIT